jgi:hypothetical protein
MRRLVTAQHEHPAGARFIRDEVDDGVRDLVRTECRVS